MKNHADPERLLARLKRLSETTEEIESWTAAKAREPALKARMDIASLLQSLLARKTVTLENLDEHASPDG